MKLFWKTDLPSPQLYRVDFAHHRLLVEKDGETNVLIPSEIEKKLTITYLPQLDFLSMRDFLSIHRKISHFHKKGYLEQRQLWLGTYFQKEILSSEMPSVRLRWIDEKVGWGVFAEKDLKPMTFIGEYAGQVRKKKRADSKNAYCFQYSYISEESTRFTIDAQNQGGIVRFINHHRSPNLTSALATIQNLSHVVFFTNRFVRQGEQLCYDYGADYWKKRNPPLDL